MVYQQSEHRRTGSPLEAFAACLVDDAKLLVVHSSIPHLMPPDGSGKWPILRAFRALADQGVTIAVPAFTFSFCNGQSFDLLLSASETGVLGDWLKDLPESIRTRHPIYSFVVLGPMAKELAACPNTTTFGPDSIFAYFAKHNASIVMAGCDFTYCTQLHYYEEEYQVPYRVYKTFEGTANFYGNGFEKINSKMYVRSAEIAAENDWSLLINQLYADGHVKEVSLWGGLLKAINCQNLGYVARRQLSSNPMAMVHEPIHVRAACAAAEERRTKAAIRIALLGSSNLDMLKNRVAETMKEFVCDRRVDIYLTPYSQMLLELTNSSSELHAFGADFTLFCDRLEDMAGVVNLDFAAEDVLSEKVNQYASAIARYRSSNGGWIFVNNFATVGSSLNGAADERLKALVAKMNTSLSSALDGLHSLKLLDMGAAMVAHGRGSVFDPRLWFLGRFPYGESFTQQIARRLAGLILAATGRTVRLLAIDLDNTLWRGILGEDGINGIAIGGDYPGNAFQAFQRGLKTLSERGIALALLSKNDEDLALKALTELPGMILRPDNFVAWRINWLPKWQNITELCSDLSLGHASVLFIDDNPVEREQMRRNQPDIKILELPEDPSMFLHTLLDSPWLECLTLTDEDRKRAASYKSRAELLEAKSVNNSNIEEFYASLDTRIYMQHFDVGNSARALQLLQKTNQFNTTSRRYGLAEIERFTGADDDIFVIGLKDRYSDFENIGLIIVRWNLPERGWGLVDNYLLSCRVLGRGIERGILHWVLSQARSKGMLGLIGEVIETPRNTPARTIFAEAGFAASADAGFWHFDLRADTEQIPPWLSIRSGPPLSQTGD